LLFLEYLFTYLCKGSDRIKISRHYAGMATDDALNYELQRYSPRPRPWRTSSRSPSTS